MRIFQVLSGTATGGVGHSRVWLRNLYEPLLDLGHDVVLMDSAAGALARARRDPRLRADFSDALMRTFRRAHRARHIDLFFSYLMDGMVEPAAIEEIRALGVPTVNFSCNNTHQFDLVRGLSRHFDFNAHSEKDAAVKFREVEANPVWFPMAANPKYYRPLDVPLVHDVTFVGQRYARRPAYIWRLLDGGVNVNVYGPGWRLRDDTALTKARRLLRRSLLATKAAVAMEPERRARSSAALAWLDAAERLRVMHPAAMHLPVTDDEMIALYSSSRLSLGFTEVFDAHDPSAAVKRHLHLRDFEAPMCGALYLTGACDELSEFFEPEKEVLVYRDEGEMLEKVRYYLGHEDEAEKIRLAGRARAVGDHTYQRRWAQLLDRMGLEMST